MNRHSRTIRRLVLGFTGTLAMLFTGTVSFAALSFLTQILMTRQLPIDQIGPLAAMLAVINFLTPAASAGVNYFMLQSFGREGPDALRWLPGCLRLCAVTTALCFLILAFYLARSSAGLGTWATLVLAASPILLGQVGVELGTGVLQHEGRYAALSTWQGLTQVGRFGVVLLTFVAGASLPSVLGGYALVGALSAGAATRLIARLWRPIRHLPRSTPRPPLTETARRSLPFALMTMFYVFYFQGPIVALEWLRDGAAAGAYNAAFLVISAMSLVPTVIYMKFLLAKICRWAEHDRSVFRAAFHVGVPAMLASGFGLMAAVMLIAPRLLPALFGASYEAGVPALLILAMTIPVRFAQTVYSSLFVRSNEVVRKIGYLGISAAVGGASCLVLIPRWSLEGAAAATLLSEVTLLLLHIHGTARYIEGIDVSDTFRIQTFAASLRHLLQPRAVEE